MALRFTALLDGEELPVTVAARDGGGYVVTLGEQRHQVTALPAAGGLLLLDGTRVDDLLVEGRAPDLVLHRRGARIPVTLLDERLAARRSLAGAGAGDAGRGAVSAPMPGKVVRVLVAPGDAVAAGQPVVIVEAMKMENELACEVAGVVARVAVAAGDTVESGDELVVVEPGGGGGGG